MATIVISLFSLLVFISWSGNGSIALGLFVIIGLGILALTGGFWAFVFYLIFMFLCYAVS